MKNKRSLLKIRRSLKKRNPKAKRQEYHCKKFTKKWKRPRGRHSKLRVGERGRGKKPHPSYSSPKTIRGLNKTGYKEVMVSNPHEIEKIDPKNDAIVISRTVGKKKRLEIIKYAEERGLKILNKQQFK